MGLKESRIPCLGLRDIIPREKAKCLVSGSCHGIRLGVWSRAKNCRTEDTKRAKSDEDRWADVRTRSTPLVSPTQFSQQPVQKPPSPTFPIHPITCSPPPSTGVKPKSLSPLTKPWHSGPCFSGAPCPLASVVFSAQPGIPSFRNTPLSMAPSSELADDLTLTSFNTYLVPVSPTWLYPTIILQGHLPQGVFSLFPLLFLSVESWPEDNSFARLDGAHVGYQRLIAGTP